MNLPTRLLTCVLLAGGLFAAAAPAQAEHYTRRDVRQIEQEYARQNNGRSISDNQLEYYLDRQDSGWTMNQIRDDIARSGRGNARWQPDRGWNARAVICSSIDNRYQECRIPFNGRVRITQQISDSSCVEGRTWGQKQGAIWVNRGCRARFSVANGGQSGPGYGNSGYTVTCESQNNRLRNCNWDPRNGAPRLQQQLSNDACVMGRTWGYDGRNRLWVNGGCRARFSANGGPNGPGYGDGPGYGNSNYSVVCESQDNRQRNCNWDSRYGAPRLQQQLSDSRCVMGRSWGYNGGNSLWVSGGCRARFSATR